MPDPCNFPNKGDCAELLVIANGYEGEIEHDGATITLVPLWNCLLDLNANG